MIFIKLIILPLSFFTSSLFAQTIAIVNIENLIDNNKIYLDTLKDIETNQKIYLKSFEDTEKELDKMFKEIEESKMILNDSEINIKINQYNNQLNDFKNIVEKYNAHYQNQIFQIRDTLFQEILKILEKYATDNSIDLVLNSTSYLIASNSLDITDIINKQLNNINIQLEYQHFEKN